MIARVFSRNLALFRSVPRMNFSSDITHINQPPAEIENMRQELKQNGWRVPDNTHRKSEKTHLSNAEYLINRIPVLKSHEATVRCIGGTALNAGHPQVYIQLDTRNPDTPVACKYCGLRYVLDSHH